jgi:hypothetical protein
MDAPEVNVVGPASVVLFQLAGSSPLTGSAKYRVALVALVSCAVVAMA